MHIAVNVKDDLLDGLSKALVVVSQIRESGDDVIVLDFQGTKFVSPLFISVLMVTIRELEKEVSLVNLPDYLNVICFSDGLQPDRIRSSEFVAVMERFSRKSYIPIIDFPVTVVDEDVKNSVLTTVENIIIRQLHIEKNVSEGLKYFISELVDNITEHSESKRAFVLAQAYPNKGYLDLCISDNGISLLGSYKRSEKYNEIDSDVEAMKAANMKISAKNLPDAENRGYGIYTSKNALIEGLGGSFLMVSGNAVYVKSKNGYRLVAFPELVRLNGTIVALRIPYQNPNFMMSNYWE